MVSCQPSQRKKSGSKTGYLCLSYSSRSSTPAKDWSNLEERSWMRVERPSSFSSTSSRRFDWLREERHVSPTIISAATPNKKPSASAFAPFSIALREVTRGWTGELVQDGMMAYLASESGRRCCCAGSPSRLVRSLTSVLYMLCARFTHADLKVWCLSEGNAQN